MPNCCYHAFSNTVWLFYFLVYFLVQTKKMNPRDLNPYLKNNGSGYPEDSDVNACQNQVLFSSLVGDGGASWRLKALKRAQEQAACEGRKLEEVCGIVLGFLFRFFIQASIV